MIRRLATITDEILVSRIERDSLGQDLSYLEWILTLRAHLRMTQAEAASRAGITQSHLAGIEAGKVNPQIGTLEKIFKALSCDLAVVPRPKKPLQEVLRGRARSIALKRLKQSTGTMALEGQAPDRDVFLQLLEKKTDEILHDRRERLWNKADE
ncbi:MAG: helix-turn-helix domain-containing protein [Elusimicrobiota bacterium]